KHDRSFQWNLLVHLFLICQLLFLPFFCSAAERNSETGYAEIGEGRIFYEITGKGLPVVLIHGGFMDNRMWDDQVSFLSKSFKVIRFDVRGYGKSSRPDKDFYPARDLHQLLNFLKIQQTALIGLSMGGYIAIDFALSYPEQTQALILAEPGVAGYKWSKEVMDEMDAFTAAEKSAGRDAAIQTLMNGRAFSTAKKKTIVYEKLKIQITENYQAPMHLMRVAVPDAIHKLSAINARTLLIRSEHASADAIAIANEIQKQIKNVKTATVPDSGHMINMEQPQYFNDLVLKFLKDE
ncbi:alpha/beta hydrolase, partial [bacterium]|nr:alpha/beta hydrolase [bacterium]